MILTGDDPGGWGSQNEEDSRLLAAAAEVPLLEPTTLATAASVMVQAFDLSEQVHLPVVVRITRALAVDRAELDPAPLKAAISAPAHFRRQQDRYNVLPIQVVDFHQRLQSTLEAVGTRFENLSLNTEEGKGQQGVLAAGYAYRKLVGALEQSGQPPLRILGLTTLHPLPANRIATFLGRLDRALVLEEVAPYVETQVQALAQRAGLTLPIQGRSSGHVPGAGELFAPQIAQALTSLLPDWPWPSFDSAERVMPSRQSLCDDCPYIPLLETLLTVMERHGGRDAFIVTGETGCMVRAQLPPWEILDVKYGMGSSIGLAAGLARAGVPQKVIALSGDSALLHSGLGELIDAALVGTSLLVIVLANETTALSGGQPHPGTSHDALGTIRTPVDLAVLAQAAGAKFVRSVDPENIEATQAALEAGLASGTLAVVIAQRACPTYPSMPPR